MQKETFGEFIATFILFGLPFTFIVWEVFYGI